MSERLSPEREAEIRELLAEARSLAAEANWPLAEYQVIKRQQADTLALLVELTAVRAERDEARARVASLENALAAAGRSLSSFIFDSDDPGTAALGAQWLYHQAMPQADDPFAQPRAFRSSVFSEAAAEVEKLDGQTPNDRDRPRAYLDGYSDGVQDAAERLEKLADQAAEGSEAAR